VFTRIGPATPLLIMAIMVATTMFLAVTCNGPCRKVGWIPTDPKISVDQNLPNFFRAVKFTEREEALATHHYFKDNYGLNLLKEKTCKRLQSNLQVKRPI